MDTPAAETRRAELLEARAMLTRAVFFWALIGLGVGIFWIGMAFVFFSAPQSVVVDVFKYIARVTCPPFLFSDLFVAPAVNAVI